MLLSLPYRSSSFALHARRQQLCCIASWPRMQCGVRVYAAGGLWGVPPLQPAPTPPAMETNMGQQQPKNVIKVRTAPKLVDNADVDIGAFIGDDATIVKRSLEEQRRRMFYQEVSFWLQNGVSLLLLGMVIFSVISMARNARGMGGGGPGGMLNSITQSNAKLANRDEQGEDGKVTFDMIAGLDSAKRELEELVDFLKSPDRYTKLGAKIPKGYLLVGPPGTGKTMLAKAVASEAGVPFFYCSAAEFLQVFVGVGASRVRDLFAKAKAKGPCIIFIDEIDAIGKARGGASAIGGNDEREQTINQLLTEMNGFESNNGVMVIGATNRADVLDKALLRPGRFDRQITVGLPDIKGREEILRVHVRDKPLNASVDLNAVARVTPGFSGADLANLANEAAICAAREGRTDIMAVDFDDALEKITIGLERGGASVISDAKRRVVAVHEAGHALTAMLLEDYDEVRKVTITPRGSTGGTTQFLPDAERLDSGLYTRDYLEKSLCVALGGRAAEAVVFGDKEITTGATGDLVRVQQIARAMVMSYGFNNIVGPVGFDMSESGTPFSKLSQDVQAIIDFEVIKMAAAAYAITVDLIKLNRDKLDLITNALLEKETVTGDELYTIIDV